MDGSGHPVLSPYARAAAEIADPPPGFGIDELRLTDYVSANAAMAASGHDLWDTIPAVATPHGWTWHHVPGGRMDGAGAGRGEGSAASSRRSGGYGRGPEQARYPPVAGDPPGALPAAQGAAAVSEQQVQGVEEDLGYRLPGAYRSFLKAAGGSAPVGTALDAELGLLVDQPFFTVRDEAAVNDLVYVNKCLRDHFTKDYLGVAFVQGGILAVKVRGQDLGSVWFCPYDDARDQDGWSVQERVERLLLPCGADFDAFLQRLAGSPPELETVANLMVDGGFARAVPVEG